MADTTLRIVINGRDETKGAFDKVKSNVAALGAALGAGVGFEKLGAGYKEVTDASNQLNSALTGLSSVSAAFTGETDQSNAAATRLASDGLMSVSDSATSLKNLLSAGFGLDQATQLVDRFKDSAAFGRQSALGFGEAIASATEGIKNGNSILVDNAGVTKNLSVLLEEAGYSQQDLGKASSDAGIRQAIFNGILRETAAQTGDAARLSESFAGSQAKLGTAVFNVKAQLGELIGSALGPIISGFAEWLTANQNMAVSIAAAGAAVLGFVSIVGGAIAAGTLMAAIIGGPVTIALLAISALLGTVVYTAMNDYMSNMTKAAGKTDDSSRKIARSSQSGMGTASKAAKDLAESLAKISQQADYAAIDFAQSMAKMVQDHTAKRDSLKQDLADETAAFTQANADRLTDFNASMASLTASHEEKVQNIEKQLNDELAKGEFANQKKVQDLQDQLAKENESYTTHYNDLQTKYDQDQAAAQISHDTKQAASQKELDAENAMLNKHAADVDAVRNTQVLDEIDALKMSYARTVKGYEDQRNQAIQKANESVNGQAAAMNALPALVNSGALGAQIGQGLGDSMKNALIAALKGIGNSIWKTIKQDVTDINSGDFARGISMMFNGGKLPGFAVGTDYAPGGMAMVGENGPEIVNLPRGSRVSTASDTQKMMSGGSSTISIGEINIHTPEAATRFWDEMGRNTERTNMKLAAFSG